MIVVYLAESSGLYVSEVEIPAEPHEEEEAALILERDSTKRLRTGSGKKDGK